MLFGCIIYKHSSFGHRVENACSKMNVNVSESTKVHITLTKSIELWYFSFIEMYDMYVQLL